MGNCHNKISLGSPPVFLECTSINIHNKYYILVCSDDYVFLHADITVPPVSMNAIIGENVIFHCAGTSTGSYFNFIRWAVDGRNPDDPDITNRMIFEKHQLCNMSGVLCSNLTVPATVENNGTTLQCCIHSVYGDTCSDNVTLSVFGKYSNYTHIHDYVTSYGLLFGIEKWIIHVITKKKSNRCRNV